MARFRIKSKWKSVLAGVLVVATVFGAVMGISALFKKDTRTLGSTAFSVGALSDKGQVQKYDQAIISDYFECQGLTIEPNDNATGSYKVFYYTSNKVFVGSSDEMTPKDGVYKMGVTYPVAAYARVMITPAVSADEYGVEESFRIRFYEVYKYAAEFKIVVSKKQHLRVNLYEDSKAIYGLTFDKMMYEEVITIVEDPQTKVSEKIVVNPKYSKYEIYVRCTPPCTSAMNAAIACEDTDISVSQASIQAVNITAEWQKITISVPSDSEGNLYLLVRADKDADICIFGVK